MIVDMCAGISYSDKKGNTSIFNSRTAPRRIRLWKNLEKIAYFAVTAYQSLFSTNRHIRWRPDRQ